MSDTPQRLQLSRKKGFKLPENTVVVSRPSKWGNPFTIGARLLMLTGKERGEIVLDRARAVQMHRDLALAKGPAGEEFRAQIRRELKGKNLACWCPLTDEQGQPVACHADVLLAISNKE